MTDREITQLCGVAMGGVVTMFAGKTQLGSWVTDDPDKDYDPLHDDAQAMALVKKFRLDITNYFGFDNSCNEWSVRGTCDGWETSVDKDLNRAICECVSKMQSHKETA